MFEEKKIEYLEIIQAELLQGHLSIEGAYSEEQFLQSVQSCGLSHIPENEIKMLKNELIYFGALTEYLEDPSISEVIINGAKEIWIERKGVLEKTENSFHSEKSLLQMVRRQLMRVSRKIDQKNPYVDARLPNGSRLCAIINPAVLGGTHVCIRKFSPQWGDLATLVEGGSMSSAAKKYLEEAVLNKRNILISGATGTGKTSLLNALAKTIPNNERIITLEDVAELDISHAHVVRLEARPANLEGEGEISIRMLLKVALRMRPDRIIVGECRSEEAIDLLQAMNTGHMGSMSTIHANSPRDALARLELLCLLGSKSMLSPAVTRAYISSAIQILVHIQKQGGRRFIHSIQEITGLEEGVFLLKKVAID